MMTQPHASPIRPHAISFDWGDTLSANTGMPYRQMQERAFAQLAEDFREIGGDPRPDFVADCIERQWQTWLASVDTTLNPDGRDMDYDLLFDAWIKEAGGARMERNAVIAARERCYDSLTDTVRVFAETAPVLAELKRRGYRLGILSHIMWPGPACRRWFARNGLDRYLDFYSFSSEVGYVKPDPRQLSHVLAGAGCQAKDILHVGDHPWRDIDGPRAFGFTTCLLETAGVHQDVHVRGANAHYRILNLTELLRLVA